MVGTTVTFANNYTATYNPLGADSGALYDFGGMGKIHVQSAYFGQPDRAAVTISLGSPSDKSGYSLTGLHVGDWFLTGTTMCIGGDMLPCPHPHSPKRFPLADVNDSTAKAAAAHLLADIARHFYDTVNQYR